MAKKINSKAKGAAGEREWAKFCREQGFEDARRGQQYSGIEGEDVVGLPGIHQEVKRVERLNVSEAVRQAIRDKKEEDIPIVAHRKNYEEWLVTMRAEDWFKLYKAFVKQVPIKPYDITKCYDDEKVGNCECRYECLEHQDYCPRCGQRLDWGCEI